MVFILFDVEAIFLYPRTFSMMWPAIGETRPIGFLEMFFYLGVVSVGYIYLWNKGAFDWHKSKK
jgi:NADH-quinone oxidoreductase subunit A